MIIEYYDDHLITLTDFIAYLIGRFVLLFGGENQPLLLLGLGLTEVGADLEQVDPVPGLELAQPPHLLLAGQQRHGLGADSL